MGQLPFRDHHLLELLDAYSSDELPLDLAMHHYFREHKSLGSKDRGAIAETAYGMVRWLLLLDTLLKIEDPSWDERLELYRRFNPAQYAEEEKIPLYIRCSCPKLLFDLLVADYGKEEARRLAAICNTPAPTTIRANRLKITREELIARWKGLYDISPSDEAPDAIVFNKKINFFELEAFKAGLFEVQDAGSQQVAALVKAKPGELVMDFCAGSGGKSLAIAPRMEGKGQLYLLDIRPRALIEARKRLKRAGIQNNQTHQVGAPALKALKKKMDWVLVDAPCSGSGTLRRNPDMKWRFNEQTLPELAGKQRKIFEQALSFMKPEGAIVYATCSLLKKENEEQLEHFCKTYELELAEPPFKSLPKEGGMDGFFGAVLRRKKKGELC